MKSNLLLLVFMAVLSTPAPAQNTPSDSTNTTTFKSAPWDTSQAHWDRILKEPRRAPEVRFGRSDFVISGPLIEGVRGKRRSSDASLGQKFLALPVVNLLVPQRMPSPPDSGGSYFAWRNSNRSWTEIASGAVAGTSSNPAYNEPKTSLISLRLSDR